ncbi:MAG: ATP-binding protein, partial [Acidimicrobiales bacterium]
MGRANRETWGVAQHPCPVIVGRDAELAALKAALDETLDGRGCCAWLVGEPGIGKSRLVREVAGWAAATQVKVVTGRAVPDSASAAFRLLAEVLFQLLRRTSLPDDPGLGAWLPALQPLVPALIPALIPAPGAGADYPSSMRGEAILQLVGRLCPDGLVMVLEDLHWADPDTTAVVEYLGNNLAGDRLFLLCTLRDNPPSPMLDVARRARGGTGISYLALERLTGEQMAVMARACDPAAPDEVVRRVEGAAEGVPLLVEELVASPGLPDTFAATVVARLRDLRPPSRRVVEAASVLGRQFEWSLLAPMSGCSEGEVAGAIDEAVGSWLMTSWGTSTQFRHALTREAVLNTVPPPRQQELAAAGLTALLGQEYPLEGGQRDVASDVAVRCGQRHQ